VKFTMHTILQCEDVKCVKCHVMNGVTSSCVLMVGSQVTTAMMMPVLSGMHIAFCYAAAGGVALVGIGWHGVARVMPACVPAPQFC
jgi:hypothetical protein